MCIIQVMNATELSGVDLNLLVVLAVLLEEASVTRAAARLGRTQSAVSHALDRLRDALGDPLFVRSGQRMFPTPRAEALRAPVAEVTSRLLDLWVRAPPFDAARAERRFSISASDYLLGVLVPQLVQRLRAAAPGVGLVIHGPKSRLPERLARGELDFGLVVYLEDRPSLFTQRLFQDRFVCVVAADHPAIKKKLDRAAFLRHPHALVSPLGGATGYVDRELARTGESRNVAVVLPDFLVAPRVLHGTDLILTLPERVARLFEGGEIRILEPPIDLPPIVAQLLWHERLSRDAAAVWFRKVVEETCRDLPGAKRP
jgi:DNA-binding transcriptional LysR family regulator